MRKKVNSPKVYVIAKPGENVVGSSRFRLLRAAATRAAEALKEGFYLEAITLTESILATRLEGRLAWVRNRLGVKDPVRFSTLGTLCNKLLGKRASAAPDAEAFKVPIQDVRDWANARNEALHEMAKLIEGCRNDFSVKYKMSRAIVLKGFEVLVTYDELDRKLRRAAGLYTATDDKNDGTAFDYLRDLVSPHKGRASLRSQPAQQAACTGRGDEHLSAPKTSRTRRP